MRFVRLFTPVVVVMSLGNALAQDAPDRGAVKEPLHAFRPASLSGPHKPSTESTSVQDFVSIAGGSTYKAPYVELIPHSTLSGWSNSWIQVGVNATGTAFGDYFWFHIPYDGTNPKQFLFDKTVIMKDTVGGAPTRLAIGSISSATYDLEVTRSDTSTVTGGLSNNSSSGAARLLLSSGDGTTSSNKSYVQMIATSSTPRDWQMGMPDGTGSFKIRDNTAGIDRMTISGSAITFNGNVTGTSIQANYQDVAEWVPASHALAPGTVVVLNPATTNEVMESHSEYDTSAAGVVSAQPGVILGRSGDSKVQVATTGRVKVKVDATAGAIRVGDLLVTSSRPGYAMRSVPVSVGGVLMHRPGTLIGKALQPLEGGTGEILVLLSLQ